MAGPSRSAIAGGSIAALAACSCQLIVPYGQNSRGDAPTDAVVSIEDTVATADDTTARADAGGDQQPDAAPVQYRPITASELRQAWSDPAVLVPCVGKDGNQVPDAEPIPIVDDGDPWFIAGSGALDDQDTAQWLAQRGPDWVIISWNPNACEYEDFENPDDPDSSWSSAGLLARGARLTSDEQLLLPDGATADDLDLVDITDSGSFKMEVAMADDSGLATDYPQLLQPVTEAKRILLVTASTAAP